MPILLLLGIITSGRSAMLSEVHVTIYIANSVPQGWAGKMSPVATNGYF